MQLTVTELMKRAGVTSEVERVRMDDVGIQYVAYRIGEQWVHIESTAPGLLEELLKLPVAVQARVFGVLVDDMPEVGDDFVIINDHDGKRRGARIVRVKGMGNQINLLLTR